MQAPTLQSGSRSGGARCWLRLLPLVLAGCALPPAVVEAPARVPGASYLVPNAGAGGFVHVTPRDMPWRVAIGLPPESPRHASREDARNAAIEGIRLWEEAMRLHWRWFALDFVREDPSAPVQVEWKRRMSGSAQGRAGIACIDTAEGLRVGGRMQLALRDRPLSRPLTLAEVRLLAAHEFGHVLGLGHCLACDSAMNYAWNTRERVVVTETDIATLRDLFARPNGCRREAEPPT